MSIAAVDLAHRFSAWVIQDAMGEVLLENDSWGKTQDEIVSEISELCLWPSLEVLIIEDLPFKLPSTTLTKAVYRLQGRIIDRICLLGRQDLMLFLPPAPWQRHFSGVWKGGITGAKLAAGEYGYYQPDLIAQREHLLPLKGDPSRTKLRTSLKKVESDYVDAFLMGRWAYETKEELGHFDVPTSSRYLD